MTDVGSETSEVSVPAERDDEGFECVKCMRDIDFDNRDICPFRSMIDVNNTVLSVVVS